MGDPPSLDASGGPRRSWPWGPALLLLGYLAIAFWPWLGDRHLLATGDSLAYYHPMRLLVAEAYRAGEWPLWNPYAFGGFPLWSPFQSGALYPGNLPYLLGSPTWALNLTVLGAYLLAGGLSYGLGRSWGWGRGAASLAALAWMGSGFMAARLEHLSILHIGSLLPGLFWALQALRDRLRPGRFLVAAGVSACLVLAGHPQFMIQGSLLALAWVLHEAWPGGWARLRIGVAAAAAAVGLGCLWAWMQIQPMLALLGEGSRTQLSYEQLVAQGITWRHGLSLAFPHLYGGVPSSLYPMPYWGAGPFPVEMIAYPGLMVLALALGGLGLARGPEGRPLRFWLAAAAATFYLSTGPAWLYALLHQLPVFNTLRVPARHLMELDFALAMAAGHAFHLWSKQGEAKRWRLWKGAAGALLGGMAAVLVGVGLFGQAVAAHLQPHFPAELPLAQALQLRQPALWIPPLLALASLGALGLWARQPQAWRQALVLGLLAADLLLFQRHVGPWQLCLQGAEGPQSFPPLAGRAFALMPSAYPFRDHEVVRQLALPDLNVLTRQAQIGGAECFLHTRRQQLLAGISPYGALPNSRLLEAPHQALDLLATEELRALPSTAAQPPWRALLIPPRWRALPSLGGVVRYRNARALPPRWSVEACRRLPPAEVDRLVAEGGWAPARLALLEAGGPPLQHPGPFVPPRSLEEQSLGPNERWLRLDCPGPSFLVRSEAHDPGWAAYKLTPDGAEEPWPLHRVDGLLMGLELPPGRHELRLRYRPVGWRLGWAVSLGSLLLALLGAFVWAKGPRSRIDAHVKSLGLTRSGFLVAAARAAMQP